MFTVHAVTHSGKVWEQTYIDAELAVMDFFTATGAVDCASVDMWDATTGEIRMEWDYKTNAVTAY